MEVTGKSIESMSSETIKHAEDTKFAPIKPKTAFVDDRQIKSRGVYDIEGTLQAAEYPEDFVFFS